MYYRTTLHPGDISTWTPPGEVRQDIPGTNGFTYPNPVLLPGEDDQLDLFFRGADWSVDFARRTRVGQWGRSHVAIRAPGQRPYLKVADDGHDTIALAFTDGHPRNTLASVYYAAYHHGSLWTASGRWIGRLGAPPIAPRRAQVVYAAHATGVSAWVWDVAFGRRLRPVIVYATFPRGADAIYWYAVFSGRRWVSHRITAGGRSISPGTIESDYAGGLTLDHSDLPWSTPPCRSTGATRSSAGPPPTAACAGPTPRSSPRTPPTTFGRSSRGATRVAPWASSGCAVPTAAIRPTGPRSPF